MTLRRLLLFALVLEAALGGWLIWRKSRRVVLDLPSASLLDPIMAAELGRLAEQAAGGGSRDWQELAQALLAYGYYGYAESSFRRAWELDPDNSDAEFGVAFCLDRTGRTAESTVAYRRLMDHGDADRSVQCLYAIGRNELREEHAAPAEEALQSIQSFPAAAYHLALLRIRTGRPAAALPVIDEQLQTFPRSVKFLSLKQRAEAALGEVEAAARTAMSVERAEYVVDTAYSRAFVERFADRYGLSREIQAFNTAVERNRGAEAEQILSRLIAAVGERQAPEGPLIWEAAVNRAFQQSNLPLARERLRASGELGVYLADRPLLEGILAAAEGDLETAVTDWERSAARSPSVAACAQLAKAASERGNADEASRFTAESLRLQGREVLLSDELPAAQQLLERSLAQHETASAAYLLGEVQRHADQRQPAIDAYSRCVRINPQHGRALDQLHQLQRAE